MIVMRTLSFLRWERTYWWGYELVEFSMPLKIVPANTFLRMVRWVIKQPCWSSLRWKSLT